MEAQAGRVRSGEALLRSNLKTFMVVGDGPVGIIDTQAFHERLDRRHKGILNHDIFMHEIFFASVHSPRTAPNGITLWRNKNNETKDMIDKIAEVSGVGGNVLLVVLDSSGRPLM